MYIHIMRYEWNPAKNEWLKTERNISFEKVIFHLSLGNLWKISDHPDQDKYPGQKIYYVIIDNYIYLVPHVVEKNYIFLKTIFPSRKATQLFLESKEIQNEI